MASMTVSAREVTTSSSHHAALRGSRLLRASVAAGALIFLSGGAAFAQSLPPPAGAPVEPLVPAAAPGTPGPSTVPAPYAATDPQLTYAAPPAGDPFLAPPPPVDEPIYDKWWFWTAIGAIAVVGIVVAVSASGSKTPNTYFGNGRAF